VKKRLDRRRLRIQAGVNANKIGEVLPFEFGAKLQIEFHFGECVNERFKKICVAFGVD